MNSVHLRAVKGLVARHQQVVSAQTYWIVLTALGFAVASGGSSLCTAAEADSGGNKIQFSSAGDAILMPERGEARERLSGAMELLDSRNSLGGALDRPGSLPPVAAPQQGLNSRLLERFDWEKNWVLRRPEDLTRTPTAEEVMQIWEYDLDRALGVRAVAGESSAKRPATPQNSSRALNPDQSDSPVVSAFGLDRNFQPRGGAHTWGGWLGQGVGSQPLSSAPLPLTQNPSRPETRANPLALRPSDLLPTLPRGQATPEIRGLLITSDAWNPLASRFDPINLGPDSTRREINPVTSPSLSDLAIERRFDTALSEPTVGANGSSRLSLLEEMTAKILGPSSFSPVLPVPGEPPKSKPTPITREPFGRKL